MIGLTKHDIQFMAVHSGFSAGFVSILLLAQSYTIDHRREGLARLRQPVFLCVLGYKVSASNFGFDFLELRDWYWACPST